eukprot:Gb_36185 [translate_table: standard]
MGVLGLLESVKRHLQRRRYERLDGSKRGRKRLRIIKMGSGKRVVWRLKLLPKLRLKSLVAACSGGISLMMKLKQFYVKSILNVAHHSKDAKQKRIDKFNEKVIVEIYKSMGLEVQLLPSDPSVPYLKPY